MPVDRTMLADAFYRQILRVARNDADPHDRLETIRQLYELLLVELTQWEGFPFSTLFARVAFVAQRHSLQPDLVYHLHRFRKRVGQPQAPEAAEELGGLGLRALMLLVEQVTGQAPDPGLRGLVPDAWPRPYRPVPVKAFRRRVRVLAVGDDPGQRQLLVREEDRPEALVRVQYGIEEGNAQFDDTIELLRRVVGFPASLNLLQVEVGEDGIFRPRALVLDPDFLVDVSSVSECFQPRGPEPRAYLLKKYLPFEVSIPLLLGNVANFLLDELLADPGKPFQELFPRVFQHYPLKLCLFEDQAILRLYETAYQHYLHLARVIRQDFVREGIEASSSQLEPTFYSEKYGLQGRLDLYHQKGDDRAIVELKSGSVYQPNSYGLSNNHFTQTLLYDLLIRSVGEEAGIAANPTSYILYSRLDAENLRFAPRTRSQQYEALQVRNKLLALETWLARLGSGEESLVSQGDALFAQLRLDRLRHIGGFLEKDFRRFWEVLDGLEPVERAYFYAFSGFIAREHRLAKVGVPGLGRRRGQAALWQESYAAKEEAFEILRRLEVVENRSGEADPVLVFRRTPETNELANFRRGDIALLYPAGSDRAPLMHQVFKGTITELGPQAIHFRLRSRQFHQELFDQFGHWNLEPDLLDSSFSGQYRGLYTWARADPGVRQLWLGRRPPRAPAAPLAVTYAGLTGEQNAILGRLISAEDYFLLWGPPGTGKTSVMLRSLVDWLWRHSEERLLLLAYTNRAVDEICGALERLDDLDYLRIGSRYATDPRFRPRLLREKLADVGRRDELRAMLAGFRVVVGTVASLANKPELFQLLSFDRMVIDEASQILEPNLLGLLPHVPRVILIGDHKQLPAVVVQAEGASTVREPDLEQLGLRNLRNALFERLYRRCQAEGWDWAYAQLRVQGRMHRDVMRFPSQRFYGGQLDILPDSLRGRARQLSPAELPEPLGPMAELLRRRVLFLTTPADDDANSLKTNRYEAELVVRLIEQFRQLYARQGRPFEPDSLGVITPYRAQIAQIRAAMADAGLELEAISVDTVERYQGGARDIILLSLCTNRLDQLAALVSLSDEGVDRKLNVALTRARERLIVVGNPDLLAANEAYAAFIDQYQVEADLVEAALGASLRNI